MRQLFVTLINQCKGGRNPCAAASNPLFNFDPPATDEEIRAAALQYVRKVSGFHTPSKANEAVFYAAVEQVASATKALLRYPYDRTRRRKTDSSRRRRRVSGRPSGLQGKVAGRNRFVITLSGVSKSYQRQAKRAVDNLSLEVKAGEIFGFLGPNGAGKTTTIKMIVGLLRPDAGQITVNGKDVVKDPLGAKAQIGYVPDAAVLYDRLTGRRVPAARRRRPAHRPCGAEGAGRRARGDVRADGRLARARPELLPRHAAEARPHRRAHGETSPADPRRADGGPRPQIQPSLKAADERHCEAGNTVFFSTHILDVAERLCDRIGIIKDGRIIAVGTMDELRSAGSGGREPREHLPRTDRRAVIRRESALVRPLQGAPQRQLRHLCPAPPVSPTASNLGAPA